jgi:hypothetical protein
MLPAPVELVKLQLHGCLCVTAFSMGQAGTGLFRPEGEVCWELLWDLWIRAELVFRRAHQE